MTLGAGKRGKRHPLADSRGEKSALIGQSFNVRNKLVPVTGLSLSACPLRGTKRTNIKVPNILGVIKGSFLTKLVKVGTWNVGTYLVDQNLLKPPVLYTVQGWVSVKSNCPSWCTWDLAST